MERPQGSQKGRVRSRGGICEQVRGRRREGMRGSKKTLETYQWVVLPKGDWKNAGDGVLGGGGEGEWSGSGREGWTLER